MDILSFYVDKKIVEVKLQWTKNKNMYLKVTKDNELLVTAPTRMKLKIIREFVLQNIDRFVKYVDKAKKLYDLKENWAFILGKKVSIKYMSGFGTIDAKLSGNHLWLLTKNGSDQENEKALLLHLEKTFNNYITKRQVQIEKAMQAPSHKFRIIKKTTSWASNSLRTKTISYALTLGHFLPKIIDYIIIHEIAHYFVPNHSQKFWDLVQHYCPNHKALSKQLKAVSQMEVE